MSTRHISFDVDPIILFDALRAIGDNGAALGSRLVAALLTGTSPREDIGLADYGIARLDAAPDRDEIDEARAERAAIVAWLRQQGETADGWIPDLVRAADAIERGEHAKPDDRAESGKER
jgi:hypothetical protein